MNGRLKVPSALLVAAMITAGLVGKPMAEGAPADVVAHTHVLQQGGFKLLRLTSGSTVRLGGQPIPVVNSAQGSFALIGFDRKEAPLRWLEICTPAAPCARQPMNITSRTYLTQNVKGVPRAKIEPDPVAQRQMQADNAAIRAARAKASAAATRGDRAGGLGFLQTFQRPSPGRVSGVFGSARLFDGQERSWHKGVDYAAPTGTPVVAPTDGVVRLARDTFMNGNMVMLDHGANLTSVYAHLHTMQVRPGQVIKAGQQLGTVGNTGRSSGPHLHWGLYIGAVAIDPQFWLP